MTKAKAKDLRMVNSKATLRLLERMRLYRPRNCSELAGYIEAFMGLKIPSQRICPHHLSPLDYLCYSFFGRMNNGASVTGSGFTSGDNNSASDSAQDIVVWANRGGGKTQLGAIATLLECIFMPQCQVRILGGSEQQSQRMYEYLRGFLGGGFDRQVSGRVTSRSCSFNNGSSVQVLTQSDKSVRGHHVQRLRCDELELFEPDIWQAAQFVTQSRAGIKARIEVFSTMHRPYGLMHQVVTGARANDMQIFSWCLWEVIERCEGRECSQCVLWSDCQGKAKQADGYYSIDDAIAQKRRSSEHAWRAEMLCKQPSREDIVFAEFDPSCHVQKLEYNPRMPLYRSFDFGFTNPLACLLIQLTNDGTVLILDEHIKSRTTLAEHSRLINQRWPWPVKANYCDPAGSQHNGITGSSVVQEMAALGMPVQFRRSRILDGIEMIRQHLLPATGPVRLLISPRCRGLIRAFQNLHYQRQANGQLSELPEKDGVNDHVIDALRYFFVNRMNHTGRSQEMKY